MTLRSRFRAHLAAAVIALPVAGGVAQAQLSMLSTVDLARRNSASVHIAQADVDHAQAALSETKDAYVPSLTGTSSVCCFTYGFPVGQPTVFNFQAQSLIFSFSQPDYIRGARAALAGANAALEDALDQVDLDTTLDYLELSTVTQQLSALNEQQRYAGRLDAIVRERLNAGITSQIAATQAQLNAAQSDLQRLHLLGQAAYLREQLSHLTELPADELTPEPESIPGDPAIPTTPPGFTAGVDASYAGALSKHYVAHGDGRQNFRPQINFGMNYARYSTFNNYQEYYRRFQSNNFDVGLQVSIPFFDAAAKARARESAADAAHADAQAQQNRERVDESIVQLRQSLPQLRAQAKIADIQATLASQQLKAVLLEMQAPPATPGVTPANPADEMEARIAERGRYSDALAARFQLLKAELSLLRLTGGLHAWIEQAPR